MCEALRNGIREYTDEKEDWFKMRQEFIVMGSTHIEDDEEFENCVCGQKIKELCYLRHKRTKEEVIVGNSCIHQFCEDTNLRPLCDDCEIYPVKETTHTKCVSCRRKATRPSGFVKFGKFKNSGYDWVWKKDPMYCMWVLNEAQQYDQHFANFCKRRYLEKFCEEYKNSKKGVENFLELRTWSKNNVRF